MMHDEIVKRMLGDKRTTRREFLAGATALGLSVSAASAMWSKAAKAAPKKGGTYRVGMHDGNTTDQLDPGTTESIYMIQMNHAVRSYLTEITSKNEIGPDAAESWEASDDAVTWTFKLFKGMEFHNGKPFTAQDAVASLNYHRGEGSKSAASVWVRMEKTCGARATNPRGTRFVRSLPHQTRIASGICGMR